MCSDCGCREVEYKHRICSECRETNHYLRRAKIEASEKRKEYKRQWFQRNYVKRPRKNWGIWQRGATDEQKALLFNAPNGIAGVNKLKELL